MSVAQMKAVLLKQYPYQKWADKVNRMSDKQIAATYQRILSTIK